MKGSILIADDEPLARRTLRQHLLDLGWAGPIHESHDGETAIAVANDQRPDLVFLDIVMPGATGLEVLKELDYLLKPFGRDRLERMVRRAQAALNTSAVPLLSRARESLEQTRTLSRIF